MKITRYKLDRVIYLLLGFFSTCSCVAIVNGGRIISLYSIFLVIAFFSLLTEKTKYHFSLNTKGIKYYFIWTLISLLSCVFGAIFFMGKAVWMQASLSYIPKICIYFLLLVLLIQNSRRIEYANALLKGLIIGAIINVAWAITDAIIFYVAGYSITNMIFHKYIAAADIRYGMLSLVLGNIIRSGGLNGDPANIGMLAPIVAAYGLYSKQRWLYGLSCVSVFASVSIIALASICCITVYFLFKKNIGIGILFIALICIAISFLSIQKSSNDNVSTQMIGAVLERLEQKAESDMGSNVRAAYWLKFAPAVITTPMAFVLGTGYGTASYPYWRGGYLNIDSTAVYDPEQTYFSTYFDVGLWGFIAFVALHLHILKFAYRRKSESNFLILFSGMEGIMISFMGYHYTIYSVAMLFLIAGVVLTSYSSTLNSVSNEKSINHYSHV